LSKPQEFLFFAQKKGGLLQVTITRKRKLFEKIFPFPPNFGKANIPPIFFKKKTWKKVLSDVPDP